nr:hypothetical protein [Actinomycetales bacterium]
PVEFGDDPDLLDTLEEAEGGALPRVEPAGDAEVVSLAARRSAASAPSPADASGEGGPDEAEEAPTRPARSRRTRRSVPSWDEIVFGSKGD